MYISFEKIITLLGNLISIITFIVALLNWFGTSIELDSTIPNKRVATAILIGFIFFSSYGSAKIIYNQAQQNESILLVWFVSTFAYVLSFLYLIDKCKDVLQLNSMPTGSGNFIILAVVFNAILFLFLYTFPKTYPNGFNIKTIFTRYFHAIREYLFFLSHTVSLCLLFAFL